MTALETPRQADARRPRPTALAPSRLVLVAALAMTFVSASARPGVASERQATHHVPGSTREFAVSVAPAPGLRLHTGARFEHGTHAVSVPAPPAASVPAETFRALGLLGISYAFATPVLGGRIEVGALLPYGHTETDPIAAARSTRVDIGDLEFVPFSWYWSRGRLHLNVQEKVYAPTGGYSAQRIANVGRNYWSFDTSIGATWFNDGSGTELSAGAGLLTNTVNDATNYETGDEFHFEFAFSQFLVPNFAIGAQGYYYNQVREDRLNGIRRARSEASAFGIGPALLWSPDALGRKWTIVASWLRDLEAVRTLEDDHVRLTLTFAP